MYIALALQNLWLEAEGTLSSYNRHADFSMGRQDMVLLSYLHLLSYLKGNKHLAIQEKRFMNQDFVRAISNANTNERTVPTRRTN